MSQEEWPAEEARVDGPVALGVVHRRHVDGDSLEDAYIALVRQHEAGHGDAAAKLFAEVTR